MFGPLKKYYTCTTLLLGYFVKWFKHFTGNLLQLPDITTKIWGTPTELLFIPAEFGERPTRIAGAIARFAGMPAYIGYKPARFLFMPAKLSETTAERAGIPAQIAFKPAAFTEFADSSPPVLSSPY